MKVPVEAGLFEYLLLGMNTFRIAEQFFIISWKLIMTKRSDKIVEIFEFLKRNHHYNQKIQRATFNKRLHPAD